MGPMPWSLEYSVMHTQHNLTKKLLALGADSNKFGTGGTPPIHDAALGGKAEVIRELVMQRADATRAVGAAFPEILKASAPPKTMQCDDGDGVPILDEVQRDANEDCVLSRG